MNVKEMIVEAGRKMYNTGLVAGTSGNISMRNPDKEDSFFITPSSMAYDQIQEHDIVEINSKGEPYIKGLRPSSEWQMHVCVYERFKKYNAIVHTHSTFATSFAVTHEDIPLILIEMRPYLEDRNSCLLANHGTISCGETLEDAFMAAEYVEDAAKIYYYAKTSGTPVIIK